MGLEPTTPGTTIRCSNQLSYMHHFKGVQKYSFFSILLQNERDYYSTDIQPASAICRFRMPGHPDLAAQSLNAHNISAH